MRESKVHVTRAAVAAAIVLLTVTTTPGATQEEEMFPPAAPESVGLSSASLEALADEVANYIDRDMAVGAELLVIKDRQTVLHEAFGWRDRESELPMERDTVFNIRSMTKPLTGAAAQALIDDGRLQLDDRVAEYLPGFDNEVSRGITVEQLLTHTSGLPLATVQSTDQFPSLQAMADATGEGGPAFEPGSRFWYSDAGTDTLGAVVEQAAGMPLADYVGQRLLEPLGMEDSYYPGDADDPQLDRTASLYVGRVGEWTRFWGPEEETFYPYAWGSQSLYATPRDYARFLAMWLDGGQAAGQEILSPEAMSRMLTPVVAMGSLGSDAPYPTQFPDLHVYHGQMALMHVDGEPVEGKPPAGAEAEILGYSGSDGTIAWAWPEHDLLILYFTQSRGGSSPIRLEAEIQRLLLEPTSGPVAEIPLAYGDLLGTYTANFGPFHNEQFEVLWRDGQLALDVPSQFIFPLDRTGDAERWTLRDGADAELDFERDEAGMVAGLRIHQGGDVFEVRKGVPVPEVEVALTLDDVGRYLGWYREEASGREVEVLLREGRLAVRIPEATEPLELFAPDDDGIWRLRLSPAVGFEFVEEGSDVVAYVARGPGGESTFRRFEPTE